MTHRPYLNLRGQVLPIEPLLEPLALDVVGQDEGARGHWCPLGEHVLHKPYLLIGSLLLRRQAMQR